MSYKNKKLCCDMRAACEDPVTHIDEKGYVYCKAHGIQRKYSMRCRQLTPKELERLNSGQPLASYDYRESV